MSIAVEQIGTCTLYCGRCEDVLPTIPTASVHLLIIDPPYHRVKMDYLGEKLAWDRQWSTLAAYLDWLRGLAAEWQRVLMPNGSLYCFAAPQYAAQVEVLLGETFTVLNSLVWRKHDGSGAGTGVHSKACKEELRSFFQQTERIIFCEQSQSGSMSLGTSGYAAKCEQLRGFVFEPIRAYLEGERLRASIPRKAVNIACGTASMAGGHFFSHSQWCLPTAPHYAAMQALFNQEGRQPAPLFAEYHPLESPFARFHQPPTSEYLRTDYEALRTDYEALRTDYEALRRPFTVSNTVPYTDVWDFATVAAGPGKHPCEKPAALLRHMIDASSRPGDTVLDPMAGSGSTLEAAKQCGRVAIGIEEDPAWVRSMRRRLSQELLF